MEGPNGARAPSEAPSDSSSDFYGHNSPPTAVTHPSSGPAPSASSTTEQEPADTVQVQETQNTDTATLPEPADAHAHENDDSSSEMDMSEPSRPASPEPLPSFAATEPSMPAPAHAGAKRKLSDAVHDADRSIDTVSAEDQSKKPRFSTSSATANGEQARPVRIPAAVWQRVFMHLSPAMLCRLLRVSREFNHYLTGMKAPQGPQKEKVVAKPMDSEAMWIHSRKTFFTLLPRPLVHLSELQMLQLIGGQTCQFCGKAPIPPPATTVFTCGPGSHGVRVIFPFGVRTCGLCLESALLKDIQLLTDPSVAQLRLGLPHGFRSPDLHFVTETVRQMPGGIPGHLRFAKVYYRPNLDAIKVEEEDAKSLGEGAADEWRKGLATKGKYAMSDSARWEKWESQLRLGANLAQVLREYDLSSFPRSVQGSQSAPAGVNGTQPSMTANGSHPLPQPVHVFPNGYGAPFQQYQHPQYSPFSPYGQQHQLPFPPQQQQQHSKPARNPQEVEEARQLRKAEIERRCRDLEPPVEPNVLQHMESFQAAMQITTPFTDAAWDMLMPRILAQREAAEFAEHQRASQLAALQAAMPSVVSDDLISKPAKETYDREYEETQMPLRTRLGEYADDCINGRWGGGKMVEKENVPIFAIQVLQHVRQRYVDDKNLGLLPTFEPPARKGGPSKQGTPTPEPFLSLDNMKWVYDNKVRPLTDVHRKEHFICARCDEEKKPKWFAFEGLIQHYGAKHTSAFSKGNIVVHWQTAEWPENPPFHANPGLWLKADRKTSDFKSHGRPRNTPQGGHDGQYQYPAAGGHSGNYTNGYSGTSPGHPPSHYGQGHPPNASNGYFFGQQLPAESHVEASHEAQLTKLSTDAREIWDALDGVKDLMECIKIHTVIHHAVTRFKGQFRKAPVLDLLTDALATNNSMRPLKNVSGLGCKSCVGASPNAAQPSYWTRIRGLKLFNTSSLITHFKLMHQPGENTGHLDWTKDMIELPEAQIVKALLRTPGMDDMKLAIISQAFPNVFPSPLPKIGVVPEEATEMGTDGLPVKGLLDRLSKKQKNQHKKKAHRGSNGVHERDNSHESLPQPKDDEYDPLRPALVQVEAFDPAQFDTDARKPPAQPTPTNSSAFNLSPETLAALQNLTAKSSKAPASNDRASRSPSVGRAEPIASSAISAFTPTGQPDIAAILASLTGQTQIATPPTSVSNRSGSVPRQHYPEPYSKPQQEPSPVYRSDARRPPSQYEPTYQAPPEPAPFNGLHELQAALSQNTRQFEQNRQQAYPERPYAAPAHATPQHQYVYEERPTYSQASTHTPVYREPQVQYIQVPDREHAPHGYQIERPVYIDQYGRPLIPVDAGPAPVQYAPNPYEQQQYHRRPEQNVYTTIPQSSHLQPVYDDRRPVYYEPIPQGVNGAPPRYAYDDGRASVPRS